MIQVTLRKWLPVIIIVLLIPAALAITSTDYATVYQFNNCAGAATCANLGYTSSNPSTTMNVTSGKNVTWVASNGPGNTSRVILQFTGTPNKDDIKIKRGCDYQTISIVKGQVVMGGFNVP